MKKSGILLTSWLFLCQPLVASGSDDGENASADSDTSDTTSAPKLTTAQADTTSVESDSVVSATVTNPVASNEDDTKVVVGTTSGSAKNSVDTSSATTTTTSDLGTGSKSVNVDAENDQKKSSDSSALTAVVVETSTTVAVAANADVVSKSVSVDSAVDQQNTTSTAASSSATPVSSSSVISDDLTSVQNALALVNAEPTLNIPTAPAVITSFVPVTSVSPVATTSSPANSSSVASSSSAMPIETPPVISSEQASTSSTSSDSSSVATTAQVQTSSSVAPGLPASSKATTDSNDVTLTFGASQQIDLDTMTIGVGGNWLQKRVYYEQASVLCEDIQTAVSACEDMRAQFWNELSDLEKNIEDFYKLASYDQGKLEEMLSSYASALSAQQERLGDLSSDERAVQQTIVEEQATVKQIGNSITVMDGISDKAYDVMDKVNSTIDSCRSYQSKAWADFKSITQTLDDQKARTLYYNIETYSANIQAQLSYLTNTLFPFFQTTLGKEISNNISVIESAIADLQSKGVDLGAEIKKYFGEDLATEQALEQNDINAAKQEAVDSYKQELDAAHQQQAAQEKERKEKAIEGSLWYKMTSAMSSAGSWLVSKMSFLEPVGSSIKTALCFVWTSCCSFVSLLCCWVGKLKFW